MKKLMIVLVSFMFLFPILGIADNKEAKYKLTDQEQIDIEQYRNKPITVGYTPGYTRILAEHVKEIMQTELDLDVELVEFSELKLLFNAVESGEVDIASGLKEATNHEDLYYSKSIYRDYRILVTTVESSVRSLENLSDKTVGFLTEDNNFQLTEQELKLNNINYKFYDSMEEVKQALYSNEIQGFIGNSSLRDYVMTDPKLISRVALQDNPTSFRIATGKEEFHSFVDICGNVIGDLSDTVHGEAIEKKITKYETELIDNYIREYYSDMSSMPEEIKINTLRTSFPNSYIDEDGKYVGNYIDMLDFFSEQTGIEYIIANQAENIQSYNEMLERLDINEVQLVLSPLEYSSYSNIINLDLLGIDDPIVSIQNREFDDGSFRSLDDVVLGVTEDLAFLGEENLKNEIITYSTNSKALTGFQNNEFDLFITHKSALDYFQRIQGQTGLIQNNYIVKDYQYTVLANNENEEFNKMFQDISRLFITFRVGGTNQNTDIISSNFINYILEQKENSQNTKIIFLCPELFIENS